MGGGIMSIENMGNKNPIDGQFLQKADPAAVKKDKVSQAAEERIPSLEVYNKQHHQVTSDLLNIRNQMTKTEQKKDETTYKTARLSTGLFKGILGKKEIQSGKEKIKDFENTIAVQKHHEKILLGILNSIIKDAQALLKGSNDDEVLKLASKHPEVVCDVLVKEGRFDLLDKVHNTEHKKIAYEAMAKHVSKLLDDGEPSADILIKMVDSKINLVAYASYKLIRERQRGF